MSDQPQPEERLYSLEEAQAALPDVRTTLEGMREARRVIIASGEKVKGAVAGNGGGPLTRSYQEAVSTLRSGVESLSEQGVIVRDVENGLVDFPSMREGRIVYLCWRLGEPMVAFWHPPETGFPGRKPL